MTVRERIIQRVLEMDDVQAERLWDQLVPADETANGHHTPPDWTAYHDPEWLELIRVASETPSEERTPFQDGLVQQAAREAKLDRTPDGRALLARNRRERELVGSADPIAADDPIWDLVGMIKRNPGEPMTSIAENHDEYLAEAYADLHDDPE